MFERDRLGGGGEGGHLFGMPADHHDRGLANCEVDSGHAPTPHGEDTVSTHQANKTLWSALRS